MTLCLLYFVLSVDEYCCRQDCGSNWENKFSNFDHDHKTRKSHWIRECQSQNSREYSQTPAGKSREDLLKTPTAQLLSRANLRIVKTSCSVLGLWWRGCLSELLVSWEEMFLTVCDSRRENARLSSKWRREEWVNPHLDLNFSYSCWQCKNKGSCDMEMMFFKRNCKRWFASGCLMSHDNPILNMWWVLSSLKRRMSWQEWFFVKCLLRNIVRSRNRVLVMSWSCCENYFETATARMDKPLRVKRRWIKKEYRTAKHERKEFAFFSTTVRMAMSISRLLFECYRRILQTTLFNIKTSATLAPPERVKIPQMEKNRSHNVLLFQKTYW